jgi:hypothetical protein
MRGQKEIKKVNMVDVLCISMNIEFYFFNIKLHFISKYNHY